MKLLYIVLFFINVFAYQLMAASTDPFDNSILTFEEEIEAPSLEAPSDFSIGAALDMPIDEDEEAALDRPINTRYAITRYSLQGIIKSPKITQMIFIAINENKKFLIGRDDCLGLDCTFIKEIDSRGRVTFEDDKGIYKFQVGYSGYVVEDKTKDEDSEESNDGHDEDGDINNEESTEDSDESSSTPLITNEGDTAAQVTQLENENLSLKAEIETLVESNKVINDELDLTISTLEDFKKKTQESNTNQNSLTIELKELSDNNSKLNSSVSDLNDEIDEKNSKISMLNNNLASQDQQIQTLKSDIEGLMNDFENKINNKDQELIALQSELSSLISNSENTSEQKKDDISNLNKKIDEITSKSDELEELNSQLSNQLNEQKQNQILLEQRVQTLTVEMKAKNILLVSKNKLIDNKRINSVDDSDEEANLKSLIVSLEQDSQKAVDIFAKQIEEMSILNESLGEEVEFYEEKILLQKEQIVSLQGQVSEFKKSDNSLDVSEKVVVTEINNDLLNELIKELKNSDNAIEKINTLNTISKSKINNELLEELIQELNIVNSESAITKSSDENATSNDILYVVAIEDANIRIQPLPGTEIIGVLKKGESIQVLAEDKNWHKTISIDGIVGYIYSPLLKNNN